MSERDFLSFEFIYFDADENEVGCSKGFVLDADMIFPRLLKMAPVNAERAEVSTTFGMYLEDVPLSEKEGEEAFVQ